MKKKKKVRILPFLLILPTVIGVCTFSFYPFVKTIISSFSFTDEYGTWLKWAGLTYWKMMFKDPDFWRILTFTLVFSTVVFVGTFGIAMLLALVSTKRTRYGKISQMMYALPIAIAHATSSVIWLFIFKTDGGLLNSWLGTNISWTTEKATAFWVVAVVTIWTHISGSFLYLLAGFRGVPNEIQEAAILDGASWFTRAVKIMIPMASPQIFYVMFLTILGSAKTFTQSKLLTSGGPAGSTTTLMYEIYMRATRYGEYEYACCLAIVLFLIVFLITRIQFLCEKKLVFYQ